VRAGFTLIEIMVVVVIISVLAAVSVPALQRVQRKAKTTTITNDFRVFAAAFDSYAQETGTWPAEAAAGVFPTGMDQRINRTAWLRKTPMGGQYNWENNQFNLFGTYKAAIVISATATAPLPLDVNMLYDLEHTIDSPTTLDWVGGSFRIGMGIVPLYLIQQ
jgi:prepilin-type N-terminal cleavage/methylation domain-containing protein